MIPFKIVIPARYGSTRLPGKPLRLLAGKPLLQWVYQRALASGAEEVIIATDDSRIFTAAQSWGAKVCMTRSDHRSGTERLAEVTQQYGWPSSQIVVNVQGDEPLISLNWIQHAAAQLALPNSPARMATLCTPLTDLNLLFNPNVVKVVLDQHGLALYFSRAPIPWDRNRFPAITASSTFSTTSFATSSSSTTTTIMSAASSTTHSASSHATIGMTREQFTFPYYRHIGLYAYRVDFLQAYQAMAITPLEQIELLEQLRVLWHGEKIQVAIVQGQPAPGVDTEADLHLVEKIILSNIHENL